MKLQQTELTPELAAQLLANAHEDQRRQAAGKVAQYAEVMKAGGWFLVPDAIMCDKAGRMFNGGHRCAAVIRSRVTIQVFICWDADPALFDVIDTGNTRQPAQFIHVPDAKARASAARLTLWYAHHFVLAPSAATLKADLRDAAGRGSGVGSAVRPDGPLRPDHLLLDLPLNGRRPRRVQHRGQDGPGDEASVRDGHC